MLDILEEKRGRKRKIQEEEREERRDGKTWSNEDEARVRNRKKEDVRSIKARLGKA